MNRHSDTPAQLGIESLEARDLLSVSSLWFNGTKLIVQTDNANTSVAVNAGSAQVIINEVGTGRSWTYGAASVSEVQFVGGAGNDRFVNNISTLKVSGWGNGGNDYLEGYSVADYFDGGDGNDTVLGYGGNDTVFGGTGDDVLLGMGGNDQLVGQDGNDRLNGRDGNDSAWGGNGDDVLIAIDGGTADYVQGDAGRDIVWIDQTGTVKDSVYGTEAADKVQNVTSFANGADRTLDGDRIADPTVKSGQTYRLYSGNPLFSSTGPSRDDIRQGALGDCWLLAACGAMAQDNPHALRQNVVDFDDGTYGVRLGNNFYRVDNDLPTTSGYSSPAYASLGRENSMWVAVVEKAYAHYRYGTNSYAALDGGWSVEVNRAFGSTNAGEQDLASFTSATALANFIAQKWNAYQATTIGFLGLKAGYPSGAPIITSHMYTVTGITRDSAGNITYITLRNPWGVDGIGNDGSNDGYVRVTPTELFRYTGRVNFGQV